MAGNFRRYVHAVQELTDYAQKIGADGASLYAEANEEAIARSEYDARWAAVLGVLLAGLNDGTAPATGPDPPRR